MESALSPSSCFCLPQGCCMDLCWSRLSSLWGGMLPHAFSQRKRWTESGGGHWTAGPSRREIVWAEARSPLREAWAGGKNEGACTACTDKHLAFSLLFLVPQCGGRGSPTLCLLTVKEPMPSAGPSHHRWHVSCVCSKLAFLPFCKKNKLELDPNKHDRKNNNPCRGLILKTTALSTPSQPQQVPIPGYRRRWVQEFWNSGASTA